MNPVAFTLLGVPVYWYGLMIGLGILAGSVVGVRRAPRYGVDPDTIILFLLLTVPAGIIGARLLFVATHWHLFAGNIRAVAAFRRGGLALHGGLAGGILAGLAFARMTRISLWKLLDIMAPGIILGQAIGRLGNYFNREVPGIPTNLPWAIYMEGAWRHPLFLYESLWNILGFGYLLFQSDKEKTDGVLFLCYLAWYSAGRIWMEALRAESVMLGGFRAAQLLSLALVLGCLLLIWWRKKKGAPPSPGGSL